MTAAPRLSPLAQGARVCVAAALLTLAVHSARGDGDSPVDAKVKDQLRGATVFIASDYSISPRDWNQLSEAMTQQMGRRPHFPASGSGFLVTSDGHIITNAHVIEGFTYLFQSVGGQMRSEMAPDNMRPQPYDPRQANKPFTLRFEPIGMRVVVNSGERGEKAYAPKILRVKKKEDLALLKIGGSDFEHLDLEEGAMLESGAKVLMAGFPGGALPDIAPFTDGTNLDAVAARNPRMSLNSGMVSAIRQYGSSKVYQLDIRANHGNSGGPITNDDGKVVGVLYAGIDTMQSINYAIPAAVVLKAFPTALGGGAIDAGTDAAGGQNFNDFIDSGSFSFGKDGADKPGAPRTEKK